MSQVRKFFGILRLELEDVEDDLETLIRVWQHRNAEGQVTEYVLKNNSALFRHEINSIKDFIAGLNAEKAEDFADIGAAIRHIEEELPGKVKEFDYPHVVVDVVQRKMEKVRRFLETDN